MKFVTLFLKTQNVHLLKDVGMIPYLLYKQYGYDSEIVTYKNEENYSYLNSEVRGLKLHFIKKVFPGKIVNGILYLIGHAKSIGVLNLYHLNLSSFIWLIFFRILKDKQAIAYLKLDMDQRGYRDALRKNLIGFIKRFTIRMADVVSVETKTLQKGLSEQFGDKIIYIPNGYFLPEEKEQLKKKNILLTVGNLGTKAKATDTLLESFAKTIEQHTYELRLVGPIEPKFTTYMEDFFKRYPECKERVTFTGPIREKELLSKEYEQAKIFVFPSRSESFGIVLVEAISKGCYVITTDGVLAGLDVYGAGRFGRIVKVDDVDQLSKEIVNSCKEDIDCETRAKEIREYARNHFLWEPIIERLHSALKADR